MSKIYIRKLSTQLQTETNNFIELKKEITALRLKEAYNKRIKNKTFFLKRAKKRNKYKKQRKERRDRLKGYSIALETNLPKSEQWFRLLYEAETIERKFKIKYYKDQYNEPINRKYIPDVHNRGYRYIIEIDGSWHDRPEMQYRDSLKDYYFKKRGYCVIRIKAFNEQSYKDGITKLKEHILHMETNVIKQK